jgi:hypothetical protein
VSNPTREATVAAVAAILDEMKRLRLRSVTVTGLVA